MENSFYSSVLYLGDILGFVVLVIVVLLDNFMFPYRKTSNVLDTLFCYFNGRNEKLIELRITEAKTKKMASVYEVKTINRYYRIVVETEHLKITSSEEIENFSITEENSYIRGVINPVMNQFEICFKNTKVRLVRTIVVPLGKAVQVRKC